jgi:hypothetical protein
MDEALQQAVADFELFLSGQRAPALVGPSLVAVMQTDVRTISWVVLNWVSKYPGPNPLETVMAARNKVFDIFFYRVVKFENVFRFFPQFEQFLIEMCPPAYRPHLVGLLQARPWQEIRPIGELKQQQVFALEKRSEVKVQDEQFNENIYRNATHNVLNVEKRYEFADEKVGEQMVQHQAKVNELFSDFVGLVKDKQARKEIFIANEADKDSVYENKRRFSIEDYLAQSIDLAVAFFNDDFLPQSCQMMDLVGELCAEREFTFENSARLQAKFELFSTKKIDEYSVTKPARILIGDILSRFSGWYPEKLLERLYTEEDRRTRRVMLSVLEAYGGRIYPMLIHQLEHCTAQTPWYYIRNLIYLLGRVVTPEKAERERALALTEAHLKPGNMRQVNLQSVATFTFIGGDSAVTKLIAKLAEFKKFDDPQSVEIASKIALALIGLDDPRAMEVALDHGLKDWNNEYVERFSQTFFTPPTIGYLTKRIRTEMTKIRRTFSLLGNPEAASNLLKCISHQRTDEVTALCEEITKSISARSPLHQTAANILANTSAFPPAVAVDRNLNRLLIQKNIPEALIYAWEGGLTGHFSIQLTDGTECRIDVANGTVTHASVPAFYLESDNAFYWLFMLDPRDVGLAYFTTNTPPEPKNILLETWFLLHEALLQRSELKQISSAAIQPNSKFSQRKVNPALVNFKDSPEPAKCKVVWDALVDNPDMEKLQQQTRFGKYELYKLLFFLIRQNLVLVDADRIASDAGSIAEGLAMLDANLQRIRRKPLIFAPYLASAEVCQELVKTTSDDTLRFALDVLGRYYLSAYNERRFFVGTSVDTCAQTLQLITGYNRLKSQTDRKNLRDYIDFAFQETMAEGIAPIPSVAPVPVSTLQKLENIQLLNDAFDDTADALFDEESVDDLFGALDAAMNNQGMGLNTSSASIDGGLTESEEAMLMELYDNIAVAYVKPLKDFIREIQLNKKIRRQTSFEWIEMVEPSVNLLFGSAEKMGYSKICSALGEMQSAFKSQKSYYDQTFLPEQAVQNILGSYEKLSVMLPKTFALELSDTDLNSKKEVLIVKFILKQIPEINEKLMNRIILAGLSTFDKFMHSSPDEISAVTGLTKRQGEDVFMKFYQYRHIYYRHEDEQYRERFYKMFDVKLSLLREIHYEIEAIAAEFQKTRKPELEQRGAELKQDRQRLLWGIFILLCIKEEYDLIESVQQSIFDVRIQKLEDYLAKLATQL